MDKVSEVLHVFFQEPFWVGVFERISDGNVSACKVTFGQEPKDYEVLEFVLKNYSRLRFSPAVAAGARESAWEHQKTMNPKRMRRKVRKDSMETGIGTKSQQALKLQQEQMKTERKTLSREQKEEQKQRQFELKQQKKKEKHKGR